MNHLKVAFCKLACQLFGHAVFWEDEALILDTTNGEKRNTLCPRCLAHIELEKINDDEYWVHSK